MKTLIKYAAIAFALLLAGSIIGGCVTAGVAIVRAVAEKSDGIIKINNKVIIEFDEMFNEDFFETTDGGFCLFGIQFGGSMEVKSGVFDVTETVTAIEADGVNGTLEIKKGDVFQVTYENVPVDYRIEVQDGKLVLKDETVRVFAFFFGGPKPTVCITVPDGVTFNEIFADNGSGALHISDMQVKTLRVDGGSGSINVTGVTAEESRLDTGSGALHVNDSALGELKADTGSGACHFEGVTASNLSVDSGSGRITYQGELNGNCIFDSGSGSVRLDIAGREADYNIRTSLGSGGLYINGRKESDSRINYENAKHTLIFNSGSGRVSVNFEE